MNFMMAMGLSVTGSPKRITEVQVPILLSVCADEGCFWLLFGVNISYFRNLNMHGSNIVDIYIK